jgi:hypothetical protein
MKYIAMAMLVLILAGCTVWENKVKIYKVVKAGVVTYMSEEQIKEAKLDKTDTFVQEVYEVTK